MESSEFLAKIIELGVSFYRKEKPKNSWAQAQFVHQYTTGRNKTTPTLDDYLYLEWRTGGISGGSCWDTGDSDPHYATSGEKEPEFSDLDTVLADLCPGVTFLQYKKLTADIIEYTDRTENEYYGNCTNYGIKTIRLGSLFEKLRELKLV